ncbi:MAG: hypothetical protein ACJ72E_02630 [Marmoricola sp.]
MKSLLQRRTAIAALLLAPTLAACGFSAQTDQIYQAAAGTNYRSGDVYILNAVVVSSAPGTGTFAGTLVNQTGDQAVLTGVTGDGVTAQMGGGESLKVAPYGYNNLGEAGDTVPPAKLSLTGSPDAIAPGKYLDLTFAFASGSTVTMQVPVYDTSAQYADVPAPAPAAPTGSPTGTGKKKHHAAADATATGTPTAQ